MFHTLDHRFYALVNACPHKQGPLSQGIVHDTTVTCPLHSWRISLITGKALGDDEVRHTGRHEQGREGMAGLPGPVNFAGGIGHAASLR